VNLGKRKKLTEMEFCKSYFLLDSNEDESSGDKSFPAVQNAFALLNTD